MSRSQRFCDDAITFHPHVEPVKKALFEKYPELFLLMLKDDGMYMWSLFREVHDVITKAGINEYIYQLMEKDIAKGNYSVIYLDDRIVGDDPVRIKAKKRLDAIRNTCFELKNKGWDDISILTYC